MSALSTNELRELKEAGVEYPWTPAQSLRLARRIDELERLLREVAATECQRRASAFRGQCGRDGQPAEGWCFVCRAGDLVDEHAREAPTMEPTTAFLLKVLDERKT